MRARENIKLLCYIYVENLRFMIRNMRHLPGNSTALPKTTKTTPTFRIVQAKKPRFVMILDVSGSMRVSRY